MNSILDESAAKPPPSRPPGGSSFAMIGILVLMVLYTMYFAAPILIPMTLALLLALILSPAVGWLARHHVPAPLGSALILLLLLGGFSAGVWGLSGPAMHWVETAPKALRKVTNSFQHTQGPLQKIQKTSREIQDITDSDDEPGEPKSVKVVGQPNMFEQMMTSTPGFLSSVGITVVLLYFLLASRDNFLRSVAHVVPRWRDKKRAVEVARGVQHDISRYLMTISLINFCLGFVDAIILWALGMPNPILWGVLIALFNFVPYAGAALALVILSLVALLTYDQMTMVLLVPACIFAVAILEGQFVTPHTLGRRLALSPVAIFITFVVWGWMWGIVGAIIAVPMLAAFKLLCEEVDPLRPIAAFLST